MKENIKIIIWNIPLIGFLYFIISIFIPSIWIRKIRGKKLIFFALGMIIQCISLGVLLSQFY